ncbi:hypothetical protein TRFO_07665 [Tritrichomonas foetus]|uniref:Uncharacterized protein n=1 Tax=Tritrichomonas foetus TaxID=1144522 RepID=A0A1J4JUS5_9EUKA|nr:hypothetical protein TRFO_07665 [Tritrichomonas foetus]|eukprot:OHT01005.1 hypothetical protein TRFO_07665 [Tritrichomonas foetus]
MEYFIKPNQILKMNQISFDEIDESDSDNEELESLIPVPHDISFIPESKTTIPKYIPPVTNKDKPSETTSKEFTFKSPHTNKIIKFTPAPIDPTQEQRPTVQQPNAIIRFQPPSQVKTTTQETNPNNLSFSPPSDTKEPEPELESESEPDTDTEPEPKLQKVDEIQNYSFSYLFEGISPWDLDDESSNVVIEFLFPFFERMKIDDLHVIILTNQNCTFVKLNTQENISAFCEFYQNLKKYPYIVNRSLAMTILQKYYNLNLQIFGNNTLNLYNESESFYQKKNLLLKDSLYTTKTKSVINNIPDEMTEEKMMLIAGDAFCYAFCVHEQFPHDDDEDYIQKMF